jgi:hypothetical protein
MVCHTLNRLLRWTLMLATVLATMVTVGILRPGILALTLDPAHCTTVNMTLKTANSTTQAKDKVKPTIENLKKVGLQLFS